MIFIVASITGSDNTDMSDNADMSDCSGPDPGASGSNEPPVVANEMALVPPMEQTDDDIITNTKMSSRYGHIYTTKGKNVSCNPDASEAEFRAFVGEIGLDPCVPNNYNNIVRKFWQIAHVRCTSDAERLFGVLGAYADIFAVGVSVGGLCSAVYRRKGYAKPDFADIEIVKFYTPRLGGRRNADDVMFKCLKAWGEMQVELMANYQMHIPVVNVDSVMSEWANRTEDEVLTDIIESKEKSKKRTATVREKFVAEHSGDLVKLRKMRSVTADLSIIKASDTTVLSIHAFAPPPSQLQCWRRDVSDGSIQHFSMKQFIYDGTVMEHTKYALVLYGPPKLGKTPFAKAVATCLAMVHQTKSQAEPFSIVVNTADSLPRGGDARMKSGVVLVFDDLRPSEPRLNRPAHSSEDMKVLGDVPDGGDMSARYSDVHFEPMMPRIFTSNASCPHEFFRAFPSALKTMSNNEVMDMDPHALALVKRFAFCEIQVCLIPQALRDAYDKSRAAPAMEVAGTLLSGANAIP